MSGASFGRRAGFGVSAFFATVALSLTAYGWSQSASFETKVHGHAFSRVTVESRGCEVKVSLPFDAPEAAYKHEAAARNIFRFHARIKLDLGHAFETPVFQNSAPGARAYSYVKDTTTEGCWAKAEHQLRAVDVEGCRGGGCKPEAFK
jgi:hypothetical protein